MIHSSSVRCSGCVGFTIMGNAGVNSLIKVFLVDMHFHFFRSIPRSKWLGQRAGVGFAAQEAAELFSSTVAPSSPTTAARRPGCPASWSAPGASDLVGLLIFAVLVGVWECLVVTLVVPPSQGARCLSRCSCLWLCPCVTGCRLCVVSSERHRRPFPALGGRLSFWYWFVGVLRIF